MSEVLAVRDVVKSFGPVRAVDGVSFSVRRGTITGLLGRNGAGKTTTIRMITGIFMPDSGQIQWMAAESGIAFRDRIGYLPEERGLYKKMQVRRVLKFLAELKGIRGREADRRITEWLERLSLRTPEKDWGLAKVDELSRGMQQKVQFIGALLHDPDLVILDEPFSGLDPVNAQALKDTVVDLKKRGKTVIFSTHLMDNAERLCDSVCIIANGDKVLDGSVSGVKASYGERSVSLALDGDVTPAVATVLADRSLVTRADDSNRFFELELAPGAQSQQLLRRLVEAGAAIRRFERMQPSLHRIFLDKVGASASPGLSDAWANVETGMSGHG